MATLKDIALAAKVDTSIVSRIINGGDSHRASAAKRKEILRIAKELQYEPNRMARSLVNSKTNLIGLIVPDLYDPIFVRYHETIDALLTEHGLQVIPFVSHWSPERNLAVIQLARQKFLDGILCLHSHKNSFEPLAQLRDQGVPVVLRESEQSFEHADFDSAVVDIPAGGYALTAHMLAAGYQRIALLGGFAADEISQGTAPQETAQGYLDAHKKFGVKPAPNNAIQCNDDGSDVEQRLIDFLQTNTERADALLVQSNIKLPGVYRALHRLGLRIGTDIGLATFSDSYLCHLTNRSITSWDQPIDKICKGLVELMLRRLEDKEAAPSHLFYKSKLRIGGSTEKSESQTESSTPAAASPPSRI